MDNIKEAIQKFLSYIKTERRYTKDTIKSYMLDLTKFEEYTNGLEIFSIKKLEIL